MDIPRDALKVPNDENQGTRSSCDTGATRERRRFLRLATASLIVPYTALAAQSIADSRGWQSDMAKPRMVIFIPLAPDDLSFSEAAYRGYQALGEDGFTLDFITNAARMSESEILASIEYGYTNGVRRFMLVGAELSAVTTSAAAQYQDAYFATVSGSATGTRVVNFCIDCHPVGGTLAGGVAARETRSGVVGFVGGVESVDSVEARRFRHAVLAAKPHAKILVDWTQAWDDRTRAARLTHAQIAAGADVVLADANDAVLAAVSQHPHVKAIGWMVDASRRYSCVVASVVIDMAVVFRRFAQMTTESEFVAGNALFSEQDHVWKVIWSHR